MSPSEAICKCTQRGPALRHLLNMYSRYCRKLTVYGSIILIGPNSTYDVAGEELVTGLSTRREHEPDWDI